MPFEKVSYDYQLTYLYGTKRDVMAGDERDYGKDFKHSSKWNTVLSGAACS